MMTDLYQSHSDCMSFLIAINERLVRKQTLEHVWVCLLCSKLHSPVQPHGLFNSGSTTKNIQVPGTRQQWQRRDTHTYINTTLANNNCTSLWGRYPQFKNIPDDCLNFCVLPKLQSKAKYHNALNHRFHLSDTFSSHVIQSNSGPSCKVI